MPPGCYWLEPSNPTKRLAPFLAHCEDGRLVNASPPWGFYELTDGQQPDPAVMASAPDEVVEAKLVGKPHSMRKGAKRIVIFRVKAGERLKAKLSVVRGKRRLGPAKARTLKPGKHTLSVVLRRKASAGPAKATMALTDDAGNRMVITRSVRVPKK